MVLLDSCHSERFHIVRNLLFGSATASAGRVRLSCQGKQIPHRQRTPVRNDNLEMTRFSDAHEISLVKRTVPFRE